MPSILIGWRNVERRAKMHTWATIGPSVYGDEDLLFHRQIARSPALVGYEREWGITLCGLRAEPALVHGCPVERADKFVSCRVCLKLIETASVMTALRTKADYDAERTNLLGEEWAQLALGERRETFEGWG